MCPCSGLQSSQQDQEHRRRTLHSHGEDDDPGPSTLGREMREVAGQNIALKNVGRITISVESIIIHAKTPEEILEGVTTVEKGVGHVKDMLEQSKEVFLLCHVESDLGEAVVLAALEHAGLLGEQQQQQIPVHRVLFSNQKMSKVSIVRQLDPHLHLEADPEIVRVKIITLCMCVREIEIEN